MKIAIQARIRHGWIQEAVNKCGSRRKLAEYLGVSYQVVNNWINFRSMPNVWNPKSKYFAARYDELDMLFYDLLGVGIFEVFSQELLDNEGELRKVSRIEAVKDVPIERLISAGAFPKLLKTPDEQIFQSEIINMVRSSLADLSTNDAAVLWMRFGLGDGQSLTLQEIADTLGVTYQCVEQREKRALKHVKQYISKKHRRQNEHTTSNCTI